MSICRLRVALLVLALLPPGAAQAAPRVIELTQVPCQFVESEYGGDQGFDATSAEQCKAINAAGGDRRVQRAEPLRLPPGDYIFRVTNKNVSYALGFWLRGKGLVARATLPSVSGGGLTRGHSLDYRITLEPGEYLYSCPLNPTPDYPLVVTEP